MGSSVTGGPVGRCGWMGSNAIVATVVGTQRALAGKRFTVGSESITFGRGDENDIVLANLMTWS